MSGCWDQPGADPLGDVRKTVKRYGELIGREPGTALIPLILWQTPHKHVWRRGGRRGWRFWRRIELVGCWVWFGDGSEQPVRGFVDVALQHMDTRATTDRYAWGWRQRTATECLDAILDCERPDDRKAP